MGDIPEKTAKWITDRPTLQAGIEGYAGLGGAIVDFFKGLVGIDKEDNRRDQLVTPSTDQIP